MRSSVGRLVVIGANARRRQAAAGVASILSPSRSTRARRPACRSKKVRARIGSVPVSLREDAPNGTQRRTTRRLKAVGASPRKSLKRRLGR
ncbi:hypothetical protein DF038_35750 [Burkholderia cepacia]|nr:hypothetical protein DF055_33950 [Burkholderia cepacia]RRA01200.1 hypothetical protein DF054_30765 [Burkholderia cepacia]RRA16722.1 hypothetical protein DF038_35750 [Burkholderia cepacia]